MPTDTTSKQFPKIAPSEAQNRTACNDMGKAPRSNHVPLVKGTGFLNQY